MLQARRRAQDLHALGVSPPSSRATATASVEEGAAESEAKEKRSSTIPSIQEFLDAIERVRCCLSDRQLQTNY